MNGLIYRWRFADSQGYIKCGRKQEILATIWIAGHSKRKKSAAWVGIPAHSLSGSVFVGWWGPIFFFSSCGVEVSRLLWGCGREDAHGWALPLAQGWGRCCDRGGYFSCCRHSGPLAAPSFISVLVFYRQHLPHESGEASLACAQSSCTPSSEACLVCWHLASPGNILPPYFSRIFLKSSAS